MTKKRREIRRPDESKEIALAAIEPKPREYLPPECSLCAAMRPEGKRYARVRSVYRHGTKTLRYIQCKFCENVWKEID